MQGPINEDGSIDYGRRGMIPRIFEYLFERMREEERKSNGAVSYFCKCSYVEIYNECIYDLLDQNGPICNLREDSKRGVYIEGCQEEVIYSPQDAFNLFEQGSRNRHVAETSMNRESSRSHSVFTIFLQSKKLDGEILDVREARFNLVDLAGSERQQFSNTAGVRLKEAGNINKSLLALSNVINALVDIANGKPRHVHYRDSRLTFLLRDSLGGNAKTLIIAAVSPALICQAETLSTLRFAQRAKQIRNKAIVNKDIQGNLFELQAEIRRLRSEVLVLKASQGSAVPIDGQALESMTAQGDQSDIYFMFSVALERQTESQAEIGKLKQRIELLEENIKRREQQVNSEKMVAKFREGTIKALHAKLAEKNPEDLFDVFDAEREQYKAEIAELRKQFDAHPEVTKFAVENINLRVRVGQLESFAKDFDAFEASLARARKYSEVLSLQLGTAKNQIANLTSQLETHKSHNDNDDIPVQKVCDSSESLALLSKSGDEMTDTSMLKEHFEKLTLEKKDLETRYEELLSEQGTMRRELDEFRSRSFIDLGIGKRKKIDEAEGSQGESMEELLAMQELLNQKISKLEDENRLLHANLDDIKNAAHIEANLAKKLSDDLQLATLKYEEKVALLKDDLDDACKKLKVALGDKNCLDAEKSALADQVQGLYKNLEAVESEYQQTLDVLRDVRSEVGTNQGRIKELESQIADLSEKLSQYIPLLSYGPSTEDIVRRIEQGDQQQTLLQQRINRLEFTLQGAQQDNEELLSQIAVLTSFADRERLATAEETVVRLQEELELLQEDLLKLTRDNDTLIKHANVKQKLQYHIQIKEENNQFRLEIKHLRDELARFQQRNVELEEVATKLSSTTETTFDK